MNKLIRFIITTIVAIAILYAISLILAAIVIVVMGAVTWYVNRRNSKIEFTEWEFHRDTTPIVSISPNGEKVYQNVSHWTRYNRFKNEYESKIEIDPVKRPINQPKTLTDAWNLRFV